MNVQFGVATKLLTLKKISWHQIVPNVLKYKQSKFYEDILHSLKVISILMFTCASKINVQKENNLPRVKEMLTSILPAVEL